MQLVFRLDKRPGESHLALDGKKKQFAKGFRAYLKVVSLQLRLKFSIVTSTFKFSLAVFKKVQIFFFRRFLAFARSINWRTKSLHLVVSSWLSTYAFWRLQMTRMMGFVLCQSCRGGKCRLHTAPYPRCAALSFSWKRSHMLQFLKRDCSMCTPLSRCSHPTGIYESHWALLLPTPCCGPWWFCGFSCCWFVLWACEYDT